MLLVYVFIFSLGAIVGSFLNVAALRWGTGISIINIRSHCPSCKKSLTAPELIPILSFFWQKGRCRSCAAKISWQYPIIEFLTGIIFLSVFIKVVPNISFLLENFPLSTFHLLFYWVVFSILIVITIYDYRHKIIPDPLVFMFISLSFFGILMFHVSSFMIYLLAGPSLALPYFLIWLISAGRWMGFGDVKLALGLGWFLGWPAAVYSFLWAFWLGGAFGLAVIGGRAIVSALSPKSRFFLAGRGLTMKSEVPFGPFMVLGAALAFLFQWDFLNLHLLFELFA